MPRFTAVGGTHNYQGLVKRAGKWFNPGSPCMNFLESRDCRQIVDAKGRGFDWTTSLNGWEFWRPFLGLEPRLSAWECGALGLLDRHMPQTVESKYWLPGCSTHLIMHSHGGNVGVIACAEGLRVNVFVTVSTPVRNDVLDRYGALARGNIGWWIHYWSEGDEVQQAGGVGDGRFGTLREFPQADEIIRLPEGAGHTGLLTDWLLIPELLTVVERMHEADGRPDYMEYWAAKRAAAGAGVAVPHQ